MWFLIKAAFWFSLVLVLLPIFGTEDAAQTTPQTTAGVDIGDTVSAASQAIGYISAICSEKPDVCVKGAETFNALGHRAKDGARIAYQLLETQFADETTAQAGAASGDAVTTGTVPAARKGALEQALPVATAPAASAPQTPEEVIRASEQANEDLGFTRIPVPEKRIPPKPHRAS
ncbi:hypothetical protein C8J36_10356 [Rhizobium sp. PP-F2F-G48]|uniref:DUF5330 domain-containing protein n=1 Tax=Rhizobium sp. PP-F2F-G48 TaxID=2135651 RepID=UPI001046D330|nr:DUF5330 domain-containing protein [Rhizobium sp. PP-F2F-G48]TCM55692.1 hypothetical protein C8J36_10356 [Rhizobium sp. PP-F2F-G48]